MRAPKQLRNITHALINRIIPAQCLLCHGQQGPLCHACRVVLTPLQAPQPTFSLPPYRAVHAPWLYGFPLDQLVNRFKHHQQLSLIRLWQSLLQIPPAWLPEIDAVVPVPLHWHRQFMRGYNQSALLARMLCHRHALKLLYPLEHTTYQRQQGRSRVQRLHPSQNPFRIRQNVEGMKLLVVDDVITTGATLRAVGQCLLQAQAASVHALVLCQVTDQANHDPAARQSVMVTGCLSTQ